MLQLLFLHKNIGRETKEEGQKYNCCYMFKEINREENMEVMQQDYVMQLMQFRNHALDIFLFFFFFIYSYL